LEGIAEAIIHGQTGFLFRPGAPDELCAEILSFLDNPNRGSIVTKNGLERARKDFDLRNNVRMLKQRFHDVLEKKPMRILHIAEPFIGGISTYMRLVLPCLVRQGFNVTLIYSLNRSFPSAQEQLAALEKDGVHLLKVPMVPKFRPLQDLRAFLQILGIMNRGSFDIVHTHCAKAGMLGRLAAYLVGVRAIFHTPHCFFFLRKSKGIRKTLGILVERLLGKITDHLVAVSPSEAAMACEHQIMPSEKCTVIYNALPHDRDTPALSGNPSKVKWSETTKVVLGIARLTHCKGIIRFLEVAEKVDNPNIVFVLAGDGELRSTVQRYMRTKQVEHQGIFLRYVKIPQTLYAIADIALFCSDVEGMPYVLLEAMRAELPIVATSVPGHQDVLTHMRTGILVPLDSSHIAAAVVSLAADEELRRDLGKRAFAHFSVKHQLVDQVKRIGKLYRDCYAYTANAGSKAHGCSEA